MAGWPPAGGQRGTTTTTTTTINNNNQQQTCGGAPSGHNGNCQDKVVWRRRADAESPATTEGSLRALLNKLAPTDSLSSLAAQVASHLLIEDDAPDQLARQLVERVQWEPLFAGTYAKLCSVLVRVRSGFVFYKHLMARCRSTFTAAVRTLIQEASVEEISSPPRQQQPQQYPNEVDLQRHRLKALLQFLCHLFLEKLLACEQLDQEYLQVLEGQLPDRVALECLCSALTVAGRSLEELRPQWVSHLLHQLHDALQQLEEDRQLRMTFMVRDLIELHQRNWQPRESLFSPSTAEQAEP